MFQFLLAQFGKRTGLFLWRWYAVFTKRFWASVIDKAADLDRSFAVRINARMLFQPLYGDYSPVGRIIGPIFRAFRVAMGLAVYGLLFSFAFLAWVAWLAIPPFVIVRTIIG